MGRPVKDPLREVTKAEEQELQRIAKARSERVDSMRRAKALLCVVGGATLWAAGQAAGLSREAVAKIVTRFNQRGLDVLDIAAGRGRKPTYTRKPQARILAEVQRTPDRKEDQTATWSLMTLRQALRKQALPDVAAETIREVLHASGYSYQQTRSWCRTGYALRKRKSGTVTTYDAQTRGAKKTDRARVRTGGSRRDRAAQ